MSRPTYLRAATIFVALSWVACAAPGAGESEVSGEQGEVPDDTIVDFSIASVTDESLRHYFAKQIDVYDDDQWLVDRNRLFCGRNIGCERQDSDLEHGAQHILQGIAQQPCINREQN